MILSEKYVRASCQTVAALIHYEPTSTFLGITIKKEHLQQKHAYFSDEFPHANISSTQHNWCERPAFTNMPAVSKKRIEVHEEKDIVEDVEKQSQQRQQALGIQEAVADSGFEKRLEFAWDLTKPPDRNKAFFGPVNVYDQKCRDFGNLPKIAAYKKALSVDDLLQQRSLKKRKW